MHRIGVDARELLGAATGVGRYLGELLGRWLAREDASRREFVLYSPEPLTLPLPGRGVRVKVIPGGRGTWWEQTSLRRAVRAEPPDVFFAPAYTAPVGIGVPLAVTIHDISFVAHPEWYRIREGLRRRLLTRRAADAAAVIFAVSEFSRDEIVSYFRVPPGRVQVVHNGLTVYPRVAGLREPVVLYVGSIFNRRHVPDLIAAFGRATRRLPDARLIVVGDDRTWPPEDLRTTAAVHGVAGRVDIRSYLPPSQLGNLYARASVFAFLSEYEGFGLPPLEALAAGVPIVVLDTPVAREIYGDAAVYVPRNDVRAAAAALERLLTDAGAASEVLGRAPAVLARYSWDEAADRTLAHLDRIAGR